jgi:D-alanine-D-alanine ligase-like ATP-grasp enzyme
MKNVLLVFGGMSYEHDISVVTAFQIMKKSRLENVNLVLFYISRENKFFVCNKNNVKISDFSNKNFKGKNKNFKEVCFVSGETKKVFMKTRFGLKEYIMN